MGGVRSGLQWLIPGMRVKRWVLLMFVGAVLANLGSVCYFQTRVVEWWAALITLLNLPEQIRDTLPEVGLAFMAAGLLTISGSAYFLVRSIAREIDPAKALRLADVINQKRLERIVRGQEIVVLGGGTGLSTMLRGLKTRTGNITAIVTVSDDGGSSGRLQREFNILPPGDIRNCLAALADEEELLTEIFQYRFQPSGEGASGVGGHSLGNLFLTALTQLNHGNFDLAVKDASRVLAIRGQVLPSTLQRISLVAEMTDGTRIEGESAIVGSRKGIRRIGLQPDRPATFPEVVEAIESASVVVIGPGSVYTSVIPNLLVPEIFQALVRTSAICVYVCNVMTQPGETDGFSAADHVQAIRSQTGFDGFDFILVNGQQPTSEQLDRYRREGAEWVQPDVERIRAMGLEPVAGNYISESDLVRHDSAALAREVFRLAETRGKRRRPRPRIRPAGETEGLIQAARPAASPGGSVDSNNGEGAGRVPPALEVAHHEAEEISAAAASTLLETGFTAKRN